MYVNFNMKAISLISVFIVISVSSCAQERADNQLENHTFEVSKTEDEWKEILSPKAFEVLREKGTERAFSGVFNKHQADGMYVCAGCQNPLFDSKTKFDSGTGWPSFYDVIGTNNVVDEKDFSHGWVRTEVLCGKCGGHLGHVFDDGPKPTGLRYCINSVSLDFVPR